MKRSSLFNFKFNFLICLFLILLLFNESTKTLSLYHELKDTPKLKSVKHITTGSEDLLLSGANKNLRFPNNKKQQSSKQILTLFDLQTKLINYLSKPERTLKSFSDRLVKLGIQTVILMEDSPDLESPDFRISIESENIEFIKGNNSDKFFLELTTDPDEQIKTLVITSDRTRVLEIGRKFPIILIDENNWSLKGLKWVNVKRKRREEKRELLN